MDISILQKIEEVLNTKKQAAQELNTEEWSYTQKMLMGSVDKCAQKVGEEATECVIEAMNLKSKSGAKKDFLEESADLVFHLLMLVNRLNISFSEVLGVLEERRKI